MTIIDKQLERAAKVAQVIAEHPDLPMMCLAPSTPSDFDSYYHDVCGASVQRMLFPLEVERLYGDTFGLDMDRTYNDVGDVAEQIESYYLWDGEHGMTSGHMFMYADENGTTWDDVYVPIADMMAEDMPWHEYIVIDCY